MNLFWCRFFLNKPFLVPFFKINLFGAAFKINLFGAAFF